MRIITPQNAALPPGGLDAQLVLDWSEDISVTGNIVSASVPIFTGASPNDLGGSYLITRYAEVTATTCITAETFQLDTEWTSYAGALNDSLGGLSIVAGPTWFTSNAYIDITNGTTLDWHYEVANYTSGAATVRVRITLVRLA